MTDFCSGTQRAAVTGFANAVVGATLNRRLHAPGDAFVRESLAEAVTALHDCVRCGVEMPLALQFSEAVIHHQGEALPSPTLQAGHLLRCCQERDIAMISFRDGLSADELDRCLNLLLLDANREAFRRDTRDLAMRAFGLRNVSFTLGSPGDPGDRRTHLAGGPDAVRGYQQLTECLQQNHVRAYRDLELAIDEAAGLVEETLQMLDEPSALLTLATQDDVDRFTVGHSVRVALLALQVARQLGLHRDQMIAIGTAALMHDIGKSKVPQEVLWKNGHLEPEEWNAMQQHPRLGMELLLEQHSSIDPCSIGAAFCHHMGPCGGYPPTALPIPLSGTSHLIRVCDVFEALTSVRPYKKALTPIEAFAVMFRHERDFHPGWLRFFARSIGLFPTGTRVMLENGADGIVLAQSDDPRKPIVRLLNGAGGADLQPGEPASIVIGQMLEGVVHRIAAIATHERSIEIPEFADGAAVLTTPHACMTEELIADANRAARRSAERRQA